jgi:hypothetical protein
MAAGKVRIAAERAQDDWDMPTPKTPREMLKERVVAIRAAAEDYTIRENDRVTAHQS